MGRTSAVRKCIWGLAMVLGCHGAHEEAANVELAGAPAPAPAEVRAAEPSATAQPAMERPTELATPEASEEADIDDLLAGALGGSPGLADEAESANAVPRAPRRRVSPMRAGTASRGRPLQALAAPAATALPQNGVLASTFVGGNGASARLDDLLDRGVMVSGERIRLQAFEDRE
ncbi:MAG: hypothetical protein AB8H86_32360, partial [Polyangiales bacterium]